MKILTRQFKNKKLSNTLRRATLFYLNCLNQYNSNITVHIVQMPDLGADGTCEKISKKEFIIELNSDLKLEHCLITLAHEAVHIKQYLTKQLKTWYLKTGTIDIWEGKRFRNVDYFQQPWEAEALLLEEQLYIDFVSECYATGTNLWNHA
jgi:Zn-finger domain-containing protein